LGTDKIFASVSIKKELAARRSRRRIAGKKKKSQCENSEGKKRKNKTEEGKGYS